MKYGTIVDRLTDAIRDIDVCLNDADRVWDGEELVELLEKTRAALDELRAQARESWLQKAAREA